ncbi:MAG: hypothetical protein ACP5OG_03180 [Candidatus Nanoarchaeia archaeon]
MKFSDYLNKTTAYFLGFGDKDYKYYEAFFKETVKNSDLPSLKKEFLSAKRLNIFSNTLLTCSQGFLVYSCLANNNLNLYPATITTIAGIEIVRNVVVKTHERKIKDFFKQEKNRILKELTHQTLEEIKEDYYDSLEKRLFNKDEKEE